MSTPAPQPLAEQRPFLVSFDSAREFSIEHWTQVAVLVESQQDQELEGYVFEDCLVTP
jgi:hypothetical protein